jgi:hypothetical protein
MAVYRVRSFSRWARKQRLSDRVLCDAVREMQQGVYEADLGGGLLKKRIARPGQGKTLLTMPTASLAKAESTGAITKVKCDGEETLKNS